MPTLHGFIQFAGERATTLAEDAERAEVHGEQRKTRNPQRPSAPLVFSLREWLLSLSPRKYTVGGDSVAWLFH